MASAVGFLAPSVADWMQCLLLVLRSRRRMVNGPLWAMLESVASSSGRSIGADGNLSLSLSGTGELGNVEK